MAEIATIARPYAEALFQASASELPATAGWLQRLAVIAADPALLQFAHDPKALPEQVLELVVNVNGEPLPPKARNFLATLLENDRLTALPEIAHQFRVLANAQSGTSDAIVYSAYPIEGAELATVQAALERRFGCKLQVTVQHAPELIGGIRVSVGDEVLDTSVKARLQQMKTALTA